MTIDKEIYRDIEIVLEYNKESKNFYATSKIGCSNTFKNIDDATKDAKNTIDNFYLTNPTSYEELAEAITNSLVWHSYEECDVDEDLLKTLVENFLKVRNDKRI